MNKIDLCDCGTAEEQVKNAMGDCVRSMFHKLKELSDKFGADNFASLCLVVPAIYPTHPEEKYVVHHVVENKKLDLVIDTSNGRRIICDKTKYVEDLVGATQLGNSITINEWRYEVMCWIAKNNVSCPNFHDGLVYMFMEWEHTQLIAKFNPGMPNNHSEEIGAVLAKLCGLGITEDDFMEQFITKWEDEKPLCERGGETGGHVYRLLQTIFTP